MIKLLLTIFFFFSLVGYTQSGKIVVRKNIIADTVIKYIKTTDSVSIKANNIDEKRISSNYYENLSGAFDIWFGRTKIYFINKSFKSSTAPGNKSIKKLKRKAKKNKLHFFELKYDITRIDSIQKEHLSIYKETRIKEPNKNEIIIVDSNFKKETNTTIKKSLNSLAFFPLQIELFDSTINNSSSIKDILFIFLVKNDLKWTLNSVKTIYKDYYKIQFNLNNLKENKLTIIRNQNEEYICNYKIKNRYLFIENPPIAELSKGKFNSKKTHLRFKIHNTNHDFNLLK